jgi:hypothetical protein
MTDWPLPQLRADTLRIAFERILVAIFARRVGPPKLLRARLESRSYCWKTYFSYCLTWRILEGLEPRFFSAYHELEFLDKHLAALDLMLMKSSNYARK